MKHWADGEISANQIAFNAIRPWIDVLIMRNSIGWELSDPSFDTQLIVNDVLAAFSREGYELTNRQEKY